jgi:methionyl-tRNA formyltransferase
MKARETFRIVFMGTPAFAVKSLEILHSAGYLVAAVVTAPDKPAGRGLKPRPSDVKIFAQKHNLPLLQPVSLKNQDFFCELAALNADLFVVVAFRMLPEAVWRLPPNGTINLHASLLPAYRGAAPINWAIINGETKTGVTTFFIDHKIDSGEIIEQEEFPIGPDETAGELHDRLMQSGSELVLKTLDAIREKNIRTIKQGMLKTGDEILKKAPKISKEDCRINWAADAITIHNHIRGLSPYPAAFTSMQSPDGQAYHLKVFKSKPVHSILSCETGNIFTEGQSEMFVACGNGIIELLEVQLAGKSKMSVKNFLNGFRVEAGWKMKSPLC